jgi:isoamyl acetate esterase
VAVGDGLTESAFSTENGPGWGLLLQMKYVRKADIINRGFGGFYTTWLVDYMLPQLFGAAHPTLAILFLGLKDSLTPAAAGCEARMCFKLTCR